MPKRHSICLRKYVPLYGMPLNWVLCAMSEIPEIISTLLEVSVTLAGFCGLVFMFRRREGKPASELVNMRVNTILLYCLLAGVSSLLPYILFLSNFSLYVVIAAPLLFLCVGNLIFLVLAYVQLLRGEFEFTSSFTRYLSMLSLILFLLMSLSVFDLLIPLSFGVLVSGIGWTLFLASAAFAVAIIRAQEDGT